MDMASKLFTFTSLHVRPGLPGGPAPFGSPLKICRLDIIWDDKSGSRLVESSKKDYCIARHKKSERLLEDTWSRARLDR